MGDKQELKGTPTAGNIYYNFGLELTSNDVVSSDVDTEPYGKRIMNCQGAKPPDTGPSSNGVAVAVDGGTGYTEMTIQEDTGKNSRFIVLCKAGCDTDPDGPAVLIGSGIYPDT